MEGSSIRVVAALTSDELCHVDADPSWTVMQFKSTVADTIGIPALQQDLLVGERKLRDEETLSSIDGINEVVLLRVHCPLRERALQIAESGGPLSSIANRFRDDRYIVLAACTRNGYALGWAAPGFRDDYDVVEAAVKKWKGGIRLASERLQRDPGILAAAGL
mmetsp:Transcript_64101/g.177867  ORF Transcript_64101/g.177867 Transcript_64101/m.177867 type:complete len:163 (+) Transcript_64101:60-548(+)